MLNPVQRSKYNIFLVTDCTNHALRIGYYSSPNCGSLHQLTDSDSKPNAYYARLNHPATYISNGQTKYYEYSAGSHLSIKLTRHALIHGIALQGSPNGLRYYLSSFQLSSKTTVHSLDVAQSPTINSDFYRESGEIKVSIDSLTFIEILYVKLKTAYSLVV